jgi:hypothetical protein
MLVSGMIEPLRRRHAMKRKRYSTEQIVAAMKQHELVFTSCTSAQLSYRIEASGAEGSFAMTRLTPNTHCIDETPAQ